jgi:hypothetical protein
MIIECSLYNVIDNETLAVATAQQFSEASGLSQVFEDQSLSNPDSTSLAGKGDSQSSLAGSITPNTSLSPGTEQGAFKKPKKRRTAGYHASEEYSVAWVNA